MNLKKTRASVSKKWKRQRFWLAQRFWADHCFIHINKCGGTSIEKALDIPKVHDTALQRIEKIGRRRWNKIYTFSVVRHPYAKVVSHYKYRVKTNQTDMGEKTIPMDEWVHASYGEKNPHYYNNPLMFAPCAHWLTDEQGTMLVEDVFKLEELNDKWPDICRRLAIPHTPLKAMNVTAQHSSTDARDLLSPESRNILKQHFAEDFERFGYHPE